MVREEYHKQKLWNNQGYDNGLFAALVVSNDDDNNGSSYDSSHRKMFRGKRKERLDDYVTKIIIADAATTTEVIDATTTTDVEKISDAVQTGIKARKSRNKIPIVTQELTNTADHEIYNVVRTQDKSMVSNVEIAQTEINTEVNIDDIATLTKPVTAEKVVIAEPDATEITTNTEKKVEKVVATEVPGTVMASTEVAASEMSSIGTSRLELFTMCTAIVKDETIGTSIGVAIATETPAFKESATVTAATEVKASITDVSITTDAVVVETATNTKAPAIASTTDTGSLTEPITAQKAVNTEIHRAASTTDVIILTDAVFGVIATNTKPRTAPDIDKMVNTEAVTHEISTDTRTFKKTSFTDIALNTDDVITETTTNTDKLMLLENVNEDCQKFCDSAETDQVVDKIAAVSEAAARKIAEIKVATRKEVATIGITVEPVARNAITCTTKTAMINNATATAPIKIADKRTLTKNKTTLKQRSTSPPPPTVKEVNFVDSSYVIYFGTIPF